MDEEKELCQTETESPRRPGIPKRTSTPVKQNIPSSSKSQSHIPEKLDTSAPVNTLFSSLDSEQVVEEDSSSKASQRTEMEHDLGIKKDERGTHDEGEMDIGSEKVERDVEDTEKEEEIVEDGVKDQNKVCEKEKEEKKEEEEEKEDKEEEEEGMDQILSKDKEEEDVDSDSQSVCDSGSSKDSTDSEGETGEGDGETEDSEGETKDSEQDSDTEGQ